MWVACAGGLTHQQKSVPCILCKARRLIPLCSPPFCWLQNGALGRGTTTSKALYRSYFPTVLTRWWKERVLRVGKVSSQAAPWAGCVFGSLT